MKTKDCKEHSLVWILGHDSHSYTKWTLRGKKAFRCPRRKAFIPITLKTQILEELHHICNFITKENTLMLQALEFSYEYLMAYGEHFYCAVDTQAGNNCNCGFNEGMELIRRALKKKGEENENYSIPRV